MTDFIEYKKSRKDLIQYTKDRLKTVRPTYNEHGSRIQALRLDDYIIYAALRGADYHKCVSPNKRKYAELAMGNLITRIRLHLKYGSWVGRRFVPDVTAESLKELLEVLQTEHQKWSGN